MDFRVTTSQSTNDEDKKCDNDINEDTQNKIIKKIKEWHPDIAEKLSQRILSECNEQQCKSFLNDLISFRIKVDNLALAVIEDNIKKQAKLENANNINSNSLNISPTQKTKTEVSILKNKKKVKYLHHAAPIRCIQYIAENNVLITGSWDKKVKYWDTQSENMLWFT